MAEVKSSEEEEEIEDNQVSGTATLGSQGFGEELSRTGSVKIMSRWAEFRPHPGYRNRVSEEDDEEDDHDRKRSPGLHSEE